MVNDQELKAGHAPASEYNYLQPYNISVTLHLSFWLALV